MKEFSIRSDLDWQASVEAAVSDLKEWIAFASVSSRSNVPINKAIAQRLETLGFDCKLQNYRDDEGVAKSNLIARRDPPRRDPPRREPPSAAGPPRHDPGEPTRAFGGGGVAYFGHSDVVPVDHWVGPGGDDVAGDGFTAIESGGRIFGRGACDMKGSIAAMVAAAQCVPRSAQTRPLWIVVTGDEETGFNGARHLRSSVEYEPIVAAQPLAITGEPTGMNLVHAHKGIEVYFFQTEGIAAHSGTSLGHNATEAMVPLLNLFRDIAIETRESVEYQNTAFDPPHLSWTFRVKDSTKAVNITSDRCEAWLSFRPMPGVNHDALWQRVERVCEAHSIRWSRRAGGQPVWVDADAPHIVKLQEIAPEKPSTACYGTDAGEFFALRQRVVWGPGDISLAHTDHESISRQELELGIRRYAAALRMAL